MSSIRVLIVLTVLTVLIVKSVVYCQSGGTPCTCRGSLGRGNLYKLIEFSNLIIQARLTIMTILIIFTIYTLSLSISLTALVMLITSIVRALSNSSSNAHSP